MMASAFEEYITYDTKYKQIKERVRGELEYLLTDEYVPLSAVLRTSFSQRSYPAGLSVAYV